MFWFGLIGALACLHVASPAAMDQHQIELKEHYEHLSYIAGFPCHDPQPRVFSVDELFSECKTHGKAYFPDVTVLHHCGGSTGCCTSGNVCVPTQVQTLHLPFKVTYLEDMEHHKKGSWEIKYFTFENHTHCSCVEPHHYEDPSHNLHNDLHAGHSSQHSHPQASSPGKGQTYSSPSGYEQNIETSSEYGRRPGFQNQRPGGSQNAEFSENQSEFLIPQSSGSQSSQRPGQFSGSQFSGSGSSQRPEQSSESQFSGSQSSQRPGQFSGSQSSQRPGQFSGSQSSQRPGQFSGSLPVYSAEGNELSSTESSITSTTNVEDLFSSLF